MAASMTIRITEDDSPHGCVEIDYDVEGFELENARVNGDLPPSLLLGARLLQIVEQELPSAGGRPVPSKYANLPTRHHA